MEIHENSSPELERINWKRRQPFSSVDGEAELFETADVTYCHAICQQLHATQLNALINKQLSLQLLLSVAHVTFGASLNMAADYKVGAIQSLQTAVPDFEMAAVLEVQSVGRLAASLLPRCFVT